MIVIQLGLKGIFGRKSGCAVSIRDSKKGGNFEVARLQIKHHFVSFPSALPKKTPGKVSSNSRALFQE
jgi:hypothetical protein